MAFNFPTNPTNGQVYQAENGYTYVYRSSTDSWLGTSPITDPNATISGPPGTVGYTGSRGVIGYTGSAGTMIGANGNNITNYPPDFVGPIPPNTASASTEFLNVDPASRIIITVYNLRITDSGGLLLQFGTDSGYIVGPNRYLSNGSWVNGSTGAVVTGHDSSGFFINLSSNQVYMNLTITLTRASANTWVCTHHGSAANGMGVTDSATTNVFTLVGGGSISLGNDVVTKLRLIGKTGQIQTGAARILYDDAGVQGAGPGSGFVGYTGSAGAAGNGNTSTLVERKAATGTAVDFTAIPNWVKRITVNFYGVSTNGTNSLQVQLGTASGISVADYISSVQSTAVSTTGLLVTPGAAASSSYLGSLVLSTMGGPSPLWIASGTSTRNDSATYYFAGGAILPGTLTTVRFTTYHASGTGVNTFDGGFISIIYE